MADDVAAPSGSAPALQAFWNEHAAWSNATFGTEAERGPAGPLKHLRKEVEEALADVEAGRDPRKETTDCLLLVLDAARRGGMTYDELVSEAWAKLAINKRRVWPATSATEAVEHDRAAAPADPTTVQHVHEPCTVCESEGPHCYLCSDPLTAPADAQPEALSVPIPRCRERVRGLVGPTSDWCGNTLPCPVHPTTEKEGERTS